MASSVQIDVVNGTENLFKIQLLVTENNIPQPVAHNLITGAELRTSLGQTIADSDTQPEDWDFTNPDYIACRIGLTEALPGEYICKLIIRDAVHLIGIAWDTDIYLTILP